MISNHAESKKSVTDSTALPSQQRDKAESGAWLMAQMRQTRLATESETKSRQLDAELNDSKDKEGKYKTPFGVSISFSTSKPK